jgi:CRISPR-associated endonuclease/helicase Cas3
LVAYLVAAHHGKVRLSARAVDGEEQGRVLGVGREEWVPALTIGEHEIPELVLKREVLEVGSGSWTARMCELRDREDLGPFRLAFLEAIVRLADWRASAAYEVTAR